MEQSVQIATYTEVNRICLRDGYAAQLRVWYWQRHLDTGGKGWFFQEQFLENVQSLGLTRKRAEQILKSGMDIFWWASGDVIRLVGLGKLDITLRIEKNEGFRVFLPVEAFAELQTFKAYAYSSWFASASWRSFNVDDERNILPAGGKTISRIALEKLFGITRYTQRVYEEITRMWVEKQIAVFKIGDLSDAEMTPLSENTLEGNKGGAWLSDVDGDGHAELLRQIPNRYTTELEALGHRKRIKSDGSSFNRGADPSQYKKSYFEDGAEALEAVGKDKTREGVAYVRTAYQLKAGGSKLRIYRTIY